LTESTGGGGTKRVDVGVIGTVADGAIVSTVGDDTGSSSEAAVADTVGPIVGVGVGHMVGVGWVGRWADATQVGSGTVTSGATVQVAGGEAAGVAVDDGGASNGADVDVRLTASVD
jgi:hypothetical protein